MACQVYDAKARFSEFLDATLKEGPQIITSGEWKPLCSSPLTSGST